MMTRIGAHALAAYVGSLETAAARLEEVAPGLPRVFARDQHAVAVGEATIPMVEAARAGALHLADTPYGSIATAALEDIARGVEELGRPNRGAVERLGQTVAQRIDELRGDLEAARATAFDADLAAGGTRRAAAIDELVASIDALARPTASFTGPDAAVATHALRSSDLPARPDIADVAGADRLLEEAARMDPRAAFDLRRVLSAWRATLVDEYVPGQELARQARQLVARGADKLDADDWSALVRLVDSDPARAFVRGPRAVGSTEGTRFADVAFDAIQRPPGSPATWNEHVAIEGMSLALDRVDADLGMLRRHARALLRQDPGAFGERQWARLAELARLDPRHRVLPSERARSAKEALGDLADVPRLGHPAALLPRRRRSYPANAEALATHWKGHVFGVGANVRMRLLDGGVDGALRGMGRVEEALGGFTGEPNSVGEAARMLVGGATKAVGGGLYRRARKGLDQFSARPFTTTDVEAALLGGPIPRQLRVADLRRSPVWDAAPPNARASLLARLVARHEPTSMRESRAMLSGAKRLPIDESQLSPGVRQRWREALAMIDLEDRSVRAVGEYREGYGGHADYANLGRLRSTLELVGMELGLRARAEAQVVRPVHAAAAATPAPAAPHAGTIDEVLTW